MKNHDSSRKNGIKPCFVTTSWDDGHFLDLKIADLLLKYDLQGTFYVPFINEKYKIIGENEIRSIAKNFEIGAHTVNHISLVNIPLNRAKKEIFGCKKRLQDIIDTEVVMFCYPRGLYNISVANIVREAGFIGARTAERFQTKLSQNLYTMSTTVHVFPHSSIINIGHLLHRRNIFGLVKYISKSKMTSNFVTLAIHFFEYVFQNGGVWHLWGHSWEIEEMGLWDNLEQILKFVAGRDNVIYCSNREVIEKTYTLVRKGR